jgi:hypothetical protein
MLFRKKEWLYKQQTRNHSSRYHTITLERIGLISEGLTSLVPSVVNDNIEDPSKPGLISQAIGYPGILFSGGP